jgi:malate dehydrogenase (oxaloacetate-decarboxylating)
LAALINAVKIRKSDRDIKIVINGAGAAGTAVAKLLIKYGFKNIFACDTKGLIYESRGDLNAPKIELAKLTGAKSVGDNSLKDVVKNADVFIGVSAPGVLTKEMVKTMAPKPIIFAMANPVPEILPKDAKAGGAYIIATGRSDYPNQINNVLAFPGIFRGALDNGVQKITDEMLVKAAENLAKCVKKPTVEKIVPNPFEKTTMKAVAKAIK